MRDCCAEPPSAAGDTGGDSTQRSALDAEEEPSLVRAPAAEAEATGERAGAGEGGVAPILAPPLSPAPIPVPL
eukprot:5846579-Prymnesium_polylepis.1